MDNRKLQLQINYYNELANFNREQKTLFTKREVYSLNGIYAADHDEWCEEMAGHCARLEEEHRAASSALHHKLIVTT